MLLFRLRIMLNRDFLGERLYSKDSRISIPLYLPLFYPELCRRGKGEQSLLQSIFHLQWVVFFALQMLIFNAVGFQIRPNGIRLIRGFSCVLSDFNPTGKGISDLQSDYCYLFFAFKMLILYAVGLQIRPNEN